MKRHGNLFEKIVNLGNLRLAHKKARRGKGDYEEVQEFEKDKEARLVELQQMLKNRTFTTSSYQNFLVYEPKTRVISKLPYFPDRIVQHAIMNIIQPIWDKIFIYDVYSAIPGKGIHRAIKRLRKFLRNKEETRYCLQFDIKKFYPSVNHDILMGLIKRKIKCPGALRLLDDIVHSPKGNKGIPIGNYTSQYFANICLNWFDHWLKQTLQTKRYLRYADDGVVLGPTKKKLHAIRKAIEIYLAKNLKLSLNSKTQVYPVDDRGIDFLGYRTFRDYVLLRKRSVKKFKRKLKLIKKHWEELPSQHIISSIMSFVGWVKHCDGYNLLKSHLLTDGRLVKIMDRSAQVLGISNPLRDKYEVVVNA